MVPKRCVWPVLLGLGAICVGEFLRAEEGAGERASEAPSGAEGEASRVKPEENSRHLLTRYESLWQRSLFHAPVQATVADPAFAREYSLAGIFEMDGSTTAALVRKRDGVVVNVSDGDGAGEGVDGLKLISVETSGGTKGTKVQLEKNGVRAWIAATPVAATAPRNSAAVPTASSTRNFSADMGEFSNRENFSGTLNGVSSSESPRQNDGASVATPPTVPIERAPEIPIPPAPSVKQPEPVPPSPLDAAMAADEKEIVVPIAKRSL